MDQSRYRQGQLVLMLRLAERQKKQQKNKKTKKRHFIRTLPATQNKTRAQRKCLCGRKLGIRRDTRFWCSKYAVALCFHECFEVYHTFKDFTKSLNGAHDSPDESDNKNNTNNTNNWFSYRDIFCDRFFLIVMNNKT